MLVLINFRISWQHTAIVLQIAMQKSLIFAFLQQTYVNIYAC